MILQHLVRLLQYNDRRARGLVIWRPCAVYKSAKVSTYGERARLPIGRGVGYVCSSTRVVRAVGRSCYACTVAHVFAAQYFLAITCVQ